jgi:hypothetical protein
MENITVFFSPWKRDATNNFRVFVYIVTTYLAFIFPLQVAAIRFLYKLNIKPVFVLIMKFYLMAKALKNEVALDFLENLKMGERVIQEIKNKKKEKYMHQHTNSNGKPIKTFNEKGVEDEKIEIIVPKGYAILGFVTIKPFRLPAFVKISKLLC